MCLVGVVVRRYIEFLILLIHTPLVSALFAESSLLFFIFFLLEEERRRRMPNHVFYFARCVRKLRYYSDVIHSFDCKSAVEHDGGV